MEHSDPTEREFRVTLVTTLRVVTQIYDALRPWGS
jgi:hypothetical protein